MSLFSKLFHHQEPERAHLLAALRLAETEPSLAHVRAVHESLLNSNLILPTARPVGQADEHNRPTADPAPSAPLLAQLDQGGQTAMLAFTDEAALAAWCRDGCSHIRLRGSEAFSLAKKTGITKVLINVAGPGSGVVEEPQITALAEGAERCDFANLTPADLPVCIHTPQGEIDAQLYLGVQEALSRHDAVGAAYLVNIGATRSSSHAALVVDWQREVSLHEQDLIMKDVTAQILGAVPAGQAFDVLPPTVPGLCEAARQKGAILYQYHSC